MMSAQPEASSSALPKPQLPLCVVCHAKPAIYTCPRCSMRTCSMSCSHQHKSLGDGCSGVRNKAAYVPMNDYGYMALMSDYTFLEEMGRKVGDWGREIVQNGFMANASGIVRGRVATSMRGGRGRGRGRGAGTTGGKTRSKRDVLKMQLDFRDIEMEMLPTGMERRILNQSTWDFKYASTLYCIPSLNRDMYLVLCTVPAEIVLHCSPSSSNSILRPIRCNHLPNRLANHSPS